MELDPENINITEEEKRQIAEHECAHAIAYEVYAQGVEWVSIEPNEKGPGRCKPSPVYGPMVDDFDLLVCKLAGPASNVVHHDDEEWRLEARRTIEGDLEEVFQTDFTEAHDRSEDAEQIEKAWKVSKAFVRDWKEVIEHLADLLMENAADPDEAPILKGYEILILVYKPSKRDLEVPNLDEYTPDVQVKSQGDSPLE